MMDEMWMRGWNDNHVRFSADIDRGFAALMKKIARRRQRSKDSESQPRRG